MWKLVRSADRPAATDTESSRTYNYYRRNITEKEDADDEAYFEFEEAKIAKNEWPVFIQNRADIEYIAMMTGVEL